MICMYILYLLLFARNEQSPFFYSLFLIERDRTNKKKSTKNTEKNTLHKTLKTFRQLRMTFFLTNQI